MLRRVAEYLQKGVSAISYTIGYIGMVALILATLIVVTDVFLRRFFNAPIIGATDITSLGLSMVVFLPMAWCSLKGGHVDLNVVVNKFPKSVRMGIELIIMFLTTGTIGLLSWQLLMYGIRLQSMDAGTQILEIPTYPFIYLATLGGCMLTLTFFLKFLYSIINLLEKK